MRFEANKEKLHEAQSRATEAQDKLQQIGQSSIMQEKQLALHNASVEAATKTKVLYVICVTLVSNIVIYSYVLLINKYMYFE